jgi:TPR repeat protein
VGFGGKSSTKSLTEIYLIFHLKVRASHLWVAPYNEHQQFLFDTITDFRSKGWNFQQIADWLNENDYLTPRGKSFRNAQYNLGVLYRDGNGVERNYNTALNFFTCASEWGNPSADFNLGVMYYNENGVPKDNKIAINGGLGLQIKDMPTLNTNWG